MALEINIPKTKWGLILPNAYVRLVPGRLYEDGFMDVGVAVYVSKAARDAGAMPLPGIGFKDGVKTARVPHDSAQSDPTRQGYVGFKNLCWVEFNDAKDV
tara:strand:+ start:2072 stop:2371 length:300 start_codon:yes stop_codon:yes gene_type:complete